MVITYNPIPGRVYDLMNIASVLSDHDGYEERCKALSGSEPDDRIKEIRAYVRDCNIIVDDDIQILFRFFTKSKFRLFPEYVRKQRDFYSFDSIPAFIEWVHHIDPQSFLSESVSFFDQFLNHETTLTFTAGHPTPLEICTYISDLSIGLEFKFSLMSILLNPSVVLDKLFVFLSQCDALFQSMTLTFSDYLFKLRENVQDANEMNKLKSLVKEFDMGVDDQSNITYSLSVLNELVIYHNNSTDPFQFIIGIYAAERTKKMAMLPLDHMNVELIGKAVGDPTRIQILKLLKKGPKYATELARELNIAHTSLFYHVSLLIEAGFVSFSTQGRKIYYSIDVLQIGCIVRAVNDYYKKLSGGSAIVEKTQS